MGDWKFNTHVVGGRPHGELYPVGGGESQSLLDWERLGEEDRLETYA